MGTALPTAGHLPRTVQTANRAHVSALSCTISRMLTKVLKIGRSGRKGTCKGQEVLCQLCLAGLEDATGKWKELLPATAQSTFTLGTAPQRDAFQCSGFSW